MNSAEKTTVLVLPGMDGTGELLTSFASQMSTHRRVQVIAYPVDRPLGYDDLVNFVIERAPHEQFVVLGESFSGPIAIEVAAIDKRVVGLILASSFARHPMPALFAPIASIVDISWVPSSLIAVALLGSAGTPELKARLNRVLARLPRQIIHARASEVLRVDKRNRLREIQCPVLCLQGRFDRLVRKKHLNEITSIQPRCQVRWLDAPHMLLESQPDAAVEAINQFCGQFD